jgi:hypothetical protein
MVKCEECKGSGWKWDNNAIIRVRENGKWVGAIGRKWKHCGWCLGTGEIDEWKCGYCHGDGTMSDDSYSTFGCPWCDGKGCRKGAPKDWKRTYGPKKPNPRKRPKRIDKTPAEAGDGSRWEEIK